MTSPINYGGKSAVEFKSNNAGQEPKEEARSATATSSSSSSSIAPAIQTEDEMRKYFALNQEALACLKSANQFYETEAYESAIEAAEKGIRSNPSNKFVFCRLSLVLANSYNKIRNYDKAVESVNTILEVMEELSPEQYKELLFKFGTALVYAKNKQKKYGEVTEICSRFLKKGTSIGGGGTSKGGVVYDDDHYTFDFLVQYAKAFFQIKKYEEAAGLLMTTNSLFAANMNKPNFSLKAKRFLGSYFMLFCTTFYALQKYEAVVKAVNVGLSIDKDHLAKGYSSYFKPNELANINIYLKAAQDKIAGQKLDDVD